ncbi:MAG: FGGY family carbohydrate kinase [Thermoplasmatota archaeon]
MSYILVLDVGTTNIKGLAFSEDGELLEDKEIKTEPIYPKQGWVEQDPEKVMDAVYELLDCMEEKLGKSSGVAITNQRSSSVVWDKETGKPLYNMITWQDTRTKELVEEYSSKSMVKFGKFMGDVVNKVAKVIPSIKKTERGGYIANLSYVSFGTTHTSMHLRWMMNNVKEVREGIEGDRALFGTIDTWVAWNLTGKHVTDYTNASATGLFDPFYMKWSDNILDIVDIPESILPEFVDNDKEIGMIDGYDVPLLTIIADQQASLYMSGVERGTTKITNGTGSFIDTIVGDQPLPGYKGIYPMVALSTEDSTLYLLEGFVNSTGSAIDWLKKVGLIEDYSEIGLACSNKEECKLTFIPAFSGLATPYVEPGIKGAIMNVTMDTSKEDLVKGMITGLAMRCGEVIDSLEKVSKVKVDSVLADGGASRIDEFLQMISDLSGKRINRPKMLNGSAYGTFKLAKNVLNKDDIIDSWTSPKIGKKYEAGNEYYENFKDEWENNLKTMMNKH